MIHPTTEHRELLELAAKAAGLPLCDEFDASTAGLLIGRGNGDLQVWNPLTDDGDALRLAVNLQISVIQSGATRVCEDVLGKYLADEVDTEGDGLAATRLAIVRAAAAIAKGEK